MTLNHSKTWPVSTFAVVQLRVDPHGRTYSSLMGHEPDFHTENSVMQNGNPSGCDGLSQYNEAIGENSEIFENDTRKHQLDTENRVVYPLSTKHLDFFTKMAGPAIRTTVRTDTVSTILEQDIEYEEQGSNPFFIHLSRKY